MASYYVQVCMLVYRNEAMDISTDRGQSMCN